MKNILATLADATTPTSHGVKPVGGEGATDTLTNDVTTIINAVIGILGLVCVVVMIIGGINYMTSAGDAGKVKKGKDTILYGLIGLVVCGLAFALVNWVIIGILNNK